MGLALPVYNTSSIWGADTMKVQGWPGCAQAMLEIALMVKEDPDVRAAAFCTLQRMLQAQCDSICAAEMACRKEGGDGSSEGCSETTIYFRVVELLERHQFWTERLPAVSPCHC